MAAVKLDMIMVETVDGGVILVERVDGGVIIVETVDGGVIMVETADEGKETGSVVLNSTDTDVVNDGVETLGKRSKSSCTLPPGASC